MRSHIIFAVLALLVTLPIAAFFLWSGDDEDASADWQVEAEAFDGGWEMPAADASAGGAAKAAGVPVFKGFEGGRYQRYDALIARYVADYNAHPEAWAGATAEQGAKLPKLTAAQVKAHMIQETGGGDVRSRSAWDKDPLQVNVPGDWNEYKRYLGLKKPRRRNEGSLEKNLRAGIMLLARKGYGVAGQPAANNRDGTFDGWPTALKRYNGRSDKTADGRLYRDAYAERILKRARHPSSKTPIEIPTKKH